MSSHRGLRDAGDAYLKAAEESKRRMPRSLKTHYAMLVLSVAIFGFSMFVLLTSPEVDWEFVIFAVAAPVMGVLSVFNIVSAHKNKTTTPEDAKSLREVYMDHAAFAAVCLVVAAWSLELEGVWRVAAIVAAVLLANASKERVRWFRRLADKRGEAK